MGVCMGWLRHPRRGRRVGQGPDSFGIRPLAVSVDPEARAVQEAADDMRARCTGPVTYLASRSWMSEPPHSHDSGAAGRG
jgi:hypothetical protein